MTRRRLELEPERKPGDEKMFDNVRSDRITV
jgi:hypothetical protein